MEEIPITGQSLCALAEVGATILGIYISPSLRCCNAYTQPPSSSPIYRPRIPAPEDCNYLVPHRHFCDYIEQAYPSVYRNKDRLEEAWQNYRLGFVRKQNVAFCDEHKHELWFREKYDPEELPLRQRVKAQGRAGKVDVFLAKLQEGQFDHLSFDQSCQFFLPLCSIDNVLTSL